MAEFLTKSVAQEQQAPKVETRTAMARIAGFALFVTAMAALAVLGAAALFAQGKDKDKYSLVSPGGIAFSDFRGYEDWADVSSARTTEILKVIVAKAHISESRCGHRLWLSQKEGLPDCAGWLRR